MSEGRKRIWCRNQDFVLYVEDMRRRGYTKGQIADLAQKHFGLPVAPSIMTIRRALRDGPINFLQKSEPKDF